MGTGGVRDGLNAGTVRWKCLGKTGGKTIFGQKLAEKKP